MDIHEKFIHGQGNKTCITKTENKGKSHGISQDKTPARKEAQETPRNAARKAEQNQKELSHRNDVNKETLRNETDPINKDPNENITTNNTHNKSDKTFEAEVENPKANQTKNHDPPEDTISSNKENKNTGHVDKKNQGKKKKNKQQK